MDKKKEKELLERQRARVLAYVSKQCTDPLEFKSVSIDPRTYRFIGGKEVEVPKLSAVDTDTLVKIILDLSLKFGSFNKVTDKFETSKGRMRSSLDIWRHAKNVNPDITIFDVMESLFNIRREIYGHHCTTVHRAVFKPNTRGDWEEEEEVLNYVPGFMAGEYKISFSKWGKLNHVPLDS